MKKSLDRLEKIKNDSIQKPKDGILRVNVCRELTFQWEEDTTVNVRWRTSKSRELFLFLLNRIGKIVRKSELIDILWPNLNEEDKAYSQLYTAVYHIRRTLRPFQEHFSIKNTSQGYALFTRNVFVDLIEWESKMNALAPIKRTNVMDYEEYIALNTGAYLEEYDYVWAEGERFRLEQVWIKFTYQLANYYLEEGLFEEAEKWFLQITKRRPEEEKAHYSLMKFYAKLQLGLLVDHQYIVLRSALQELNLEVSSEIQSWYKHWREDKSKNH